MEKSTSSNAANGHVIGELSWFGLQMSSACFICMFSAHSLQMLARCVTCCCRNPNLFFTHFSTSISSISLFSNPFCRVISPLTPLIKPWLSSFNGFFRLPLHFSIYKSVFLAYVSIKVDNFLSDIHRDGTHRQIFDLHRPQDQREDRRLLRVCETKREVHCCLRDCDET